MLLSSKQSSSWCHCQPSKKNWLQKREGQIATQLFYTSREKELGLFNTVKGSYMERICRDKAKFRQYVVSTIKRIPRKWYGCYQQKHVSCISFCMYSGLLWRSVMSVYVYWDSQNIMLLRLGNKKFFKH